MFLPDEGVLRAEEKCEQVATLNTESLERPMTTEAPITDIPTTAYFHGPMPDRAISQHFVSRRNTAAIIDGSGQNLQTVEVPMTAADPNFYFLRDGDGTRRTLEVRDETDDVDMRAHGRAMEELSKVKIMYMLAFCRQAGRIARSHACGLAGLQAIAGTCTHPTQLAHPYSPAHSRPVRYVQQVERTGMVQTVRPLKNGGMLPTSKDCFRDPMMQVMLCSFPMYGYACMLLSPHPPPTTNSPHPGNSTRTCTQADMIAQAQAKIAEERKAAASVAEPYGETSRIIIPHVFKHESGVMSVDRRIELMMQTRKQPENPPKATLSSAKDLIYSSAPPPPPQI